MIHGNSVGKFVLSDIVFQLNKKLKENMYDTDIIYQLKEKRKSRESGNNWTILLIYEKVN